MMVWCNSLLVISVERRNKKQETRNKKHETRNEKQETRNKKQERMQHSGSLITGLDGYGVISDGFVLGYRFSVY